MKDQFLVATSSGKKTVYLPLSRLLRIEVIPARGASVSAVAIVFEGYQVNVQTPPGTEETFVQELSNKLASPEMLDLVYLRPDPDKGVNVQFQQQEL
jgi:hypothetical protein